MKRLKKSYISEIDKFLAEFDQSHPKKSDSQRQEVAKHRRIAKLRDNETEKG